MMHIIYLLLSSVHSMLMQWCKILKFRWVQLELSYFEMKKGLDKRHIELGTSTSNFSRTVHRGTFIFQFQLQVFYFKFQFLLWTATDTYLAIYLLTDTCFHRTESKIEVHPEFELTFTTHLKSKLYVTLDCFTGQYEEIEFLLCNLLTC